MTTEKPTEDRSQLAGGVTWGCRQIGISRTTFYELIKSGDIKTFTIGGRRLVRREDIEAFLKKQVSNAN